MYRRPTENVYNISYGLNKKLYFKRGREEETDEGREAARERKREKRMWGWGGVRAENAPIKYLTHD